MSSENPVADRLGAAVQDYQAAVDDFDREVARLLESATGTGTSARAVGAAVGRNPISIIIPCHRVIGADGSLTGYAGGIDKKALLLAHEETLG